MANHLEYGHECKVCKPLRPATSPLSGPLLGRRSFFKLAGAGVSGFFLSSLLRSEVVARPAGAQLFGTARNCIYIHLNGAPSHLDTFDLKEGAWTPSDFMPTTVNGIRFPVGLMPNLAGQLNRMAIVRSMRAPALVHPLQQTWAQIARSPSSALGKVAPNIGSVVALEFESQRQATQKLPGFVSLNTGGTVMGAGYFDGLYSPFDVTTDPTGLGTLANSDGQTRFESRYAVLQSIDNALRTNSPLGSDVTTMGGFYDAGRGMMYDAAVDAAFKFTTEEQTRYGGSSFGDSCIVARNLVQGNLGTRYVQINFGGWDHHDDIYLAGAGIYSQTAMLDKGLASLLNDLAAAPGTRGGSLLDETLVVAMGEFGRTVGPLTGQGGRDHYFQHFAVLSGGGVTGGMVIGETNSAGSTVSNPGWSANRPASYEDIAATIYAALGIDYLTVRNDDPLGRGFEYVPFAAEGYWAPITELFARNIQQRPVTRPGTGRTNTGRKVS